MPRPAISFTAVFAIVCSAFICSAQQTSLTRLQRVEAVADADQSTAVRQEIGNSVPRLVRFVGQLPIHNRGGEPAAPATRMVTFSLYAEQQGGEPIWSETQIVNFDVTGQYSVMLGASALAGVPVEAFTSGAARWLEVTIEGEPPQPRLLLVSVPFALKAEDAAKLDGKGAGEYVTKSDMQAAVQQSVSQALQAASAANGGTKPQPGGIDDSTGSNNSVGRVQPTVAQQGLTGSGAASFSDTSGNEVVFVNQSGTGMGVNAATTGTVAVNGTSTSSTGMGVHGAASSTTGSAVGVRGDSAADSGQGVVGFASSQTGSGAGVVGQSSGATGTGVQGQATGASGVGVHGTASSPSGTAVGVMGETLSPDGTAGLFNVSQSGATILKGELNGTQKFAVDSQGNVAANGVVTATRFVGDGSGLTGLSGVTGLQGPTGPQGPTGETGPIGPQGPAGASPFSLIGSDAIFTAGNVGIGASTPAANLEVASNGMQNTFRISSTSPNNLGANGWNFGFNGDGNLVTQAAWDRWSLFVDTDATVPNNSGFTIYQGAAPSGKPNLLFDVTSSNGVGNVLATGNITANGTVTAKAFSGDGSQLTGIVAKSGDATTLGGLPPSAFAQVGAATNAFTGTTVFNTTRTLNQEVTGTFQADANATVDGQFMANGAITANSGIIANEQIVSNSDLALVNNAPGGVFLKRSGGDTNTWLYQTALPKFGFFWCDDDVNCIGNGMAGEDILFTVDANQFPIGFPLNSNTVAGIAPATNATIRLTPPSGGAYFAGNVGIGNSTPADKLAVTGNISSTGTVTAKQFIGDGSQLTGIVAKSGDASTLGGLPPSAFAQVSGTNAYTGTNAFTTAIVSTDLNLPGGAEVATDFARFPTISIGNGSVSGLLDAATLQTDNGANLNSNSPSGVAATVTNSGGGLILSGRNGSAEVFRLDGNPAPQNTLLVTSNTVGIPNPNPIAPLPPVAIFGDQVNATGFTVGVAGRTNANDGGGAGVAGLATGISTTKNAATGVVGIATASTGRQIGVQGQINTSDPNSAAADFINNGSSTGMIIVGEGLSPVQNCDSPPCTDQVFSVDASGNVKANSFTGLNGNPISVMGAQTITSQAGAPSLTLANTAATPGTPLPLLVAQAPDANGQLKEVFSLDSTGTFNGFIANLVGFNAGLLVHDTNDGSNPSLQGTRFALSAREDAPGSIAIQGRAAAATSLTFGVRGMTDSSSDFAAGVQGVATATTGTLFGVHGLVNTPTAVGVQGSNFGDGGAGVRGFGNGTNAFNAGVEGFSRSPNGAGAHGNNLATTGNGIGVLAEVQSPTGQALQLKVPSTSGTLISALTNGTSMFSVDGAGNVKTNGTINATKFIGDGSQLTGVTATVGVFTGSGNTSAINATTNVGDGAPTALLSNTGGGFVLRATDGTNDILSVNAGNGGLVSASSLAIGAGQTITQHLSTTATVQIPNNISAGNCVDIPINVPGAADGDAVVVGVPSDFANFNGIQVTGLIGGPGTVIVRGCDNTFNFEDIQRTPPPQLTFRVDVWKHDPQSNDTGQSAGLVVTTNMLAFQPTQFGQSSFLTVTLLNPGSTPISNISATSSDPAFQVFQQCQTIGPNQSCQLEVEFAPMAAQQPTQPQAFSGKVTISTTVNNVTSVAKVITATGTGTPQSGSLSVSPEFMDFGDIPVGSTTTANFTVSNSSASAVTFSISGLSAPFSLVPNTCADPTGANIVPANGSCVLTIQFLPTQPTSQGTEVVLTDSSGNSTQFFVSGDGVAGVPVTYDNTGKQTNSHIVSGQAVGPNGFANGVQVTLLNAAVFKSSSSYVCTATVVGSSSGLTVSVRLDDGSHFTIFSNATSGAINYMCIGN